ncbi:MAG: tetratricopeptide repeat protein [Planctomycetes bacterium]|nr:tetratricopeptide repeat protein [Planctomycetota bacterium]
MHDEADRMLAEGHLDEAIAFYREHLELEPTAEGFNNMGVALERSGRLDEAAEAYNRALLLPQATRATQKSLYRVRLRILLKRILPWAAWLLAGLATVLGLAWLRKRLVSAWREFCDRRRYRHVRMTGLSCRVQCQDGEYQPDGYLYSDSASLSIKAELELPVRQDIYPLNFSLELRRPDGRAACTLRENVQQVETRRVELWFTRYYVSDLLANPGTWTARLTLENVHRTLGQLEVKVVSREMLVKDLVAEQPELVVVRSGVPHVSTTVLTDVDSVVPRVRLRPRHYHPSKYDGMQLRLDLARPNGDQVGDSTSLPIEFADGVAVVDQLECPVAGSLIAGKTGRWEFRLLVEDHQLGTIPFALMTEQQVRESVKLARIDVAGTTRAGRIVPVGQFTYAQDLMSLCPIASFYTPHPVPWLEHGLTVGVCLEDEPIGEVEGQIAFNQDCADFIPGELPLPLWRRGQEEIRVSFIFFLGHRQLAIREVRIHKARPKCTDRQGRITTSTEWRQADWDSEASRLLAEAEACH